MSEQEKSIVKQVVSALQSRAVPISLNLPADPSLADVENAIVDASASGHLSGEDAAAALNALRSLSNTSNER